MRAALGFLAGGAAVLAGCSPEPAALSVDTIEWSEQELLGLSAERRARLAELAALGLAIAGNRAREVLEPAIARDRDEALITQAAAEAHLASIGAADDQLRARYRIEPEWELTVRHVLFFSERWRPQEHRAQARAKAEAALERLRTGEAFPRIAAELSEEPGAEGREGLLSPGREGSWVEEFWNAALALEVGGISPVTETRYGFHVLRLEDRRVVPFVEARPRVVREVASMSGSLDFLRDQWLSALADSVRTETSGGSTSVESATRARALSTAREAGIRIPPAETAKIERKWDDTLFRWASSLGFRTGTSGDQVKAAARAALGATGQGAAIARSEVERVGGILLAAFDVSRGDVGG